MTNNQIAEQLKTLSVWNKRFYSWPIHRQAIENPDNYNIINEAVRLSMSAGVGMYNHVPTSTIDILANMIKSHQYPSRIEWTVSLAPYHLAEQYLGIIGADDPFNWGAEHDAEIDFIYTHLKEILEAIKNKQTSLGLNNKVGMIFLDTERELLYPNGNVSHDLNAKQKFNAVYSIIRSVCQSVLGYKPKIGWYEQHGKGLVNGAWRNLGPDATASGDFGSISMYQIEDPYLCVAQYNKSAANTIKDMIPVVCLGGGYYRDFNTWANAGYKVAESPIYPYLNSWLMGRFIQWSPWNTPEDMGNFNRAPYGMFWPGFAEPDYKYWPIHFLAFAYGCANIQQLPE